MESESVLLEQRIFLPSHIHTTVFTECFVPDKGTDIMKVLNIYAGLLTETLLLFENPDQGLEYTYDKLARALGTEPYEGYLESDALPPADVLDRYTEKGRALARDVFAEWVDCVHEFHQELISLITQTILHWEQQKSWRAETFRLFIEISNRCMAYEMAAQELCDVVIERKILEENWSLGDGLSALSGVCGRRLALSLNETGYWRPGRFNMLAAPIDDVVHVMTQEATRLGIPAGSDWYKGVAANDAPADPPSDLVDSIEPYALVFYEMLGLTNLREQAVASAKGAGRMLAIAAGGERPEMAPVIAKPLSMAALSEMYKYVFTEELFLS